MAHDIQMFMAGCSAGVAFVVILTTWVNVRNNQKSIKAKLSITATMLVIIAISGQQLAHIL